MKNKQTIQDVDMRIEILIKRLARTAIELNLLRLKRKKMVTGKNKVPPPPGKKHMFRTEDRTAVAVLHNDDIPSFLTERAPRN